MKLVSIHKQIWAILLLLSWNAAFSQTWSLQQCLDTAGVNNKLLLISKNEIQISIQKQQEVRANLLPKVNLNGEYKYFLDLPYQFMPANAFNPAAPEGQFMKAQFGVPHNINANLQLGMPLYNPQIYGAIENTKRATELSELQHQQKEEQIYFDITNLYYNAQVLHHQLQFIEGNLTNTEKLLKNMQLLQTNLLAKGTDVSRVQLQVTQLITQKEKINSQYNQVLNALKFAMGLPYQYDLKIVTDIEYTEREPFQEGSTLNYRLLQTKNLLLTGELKTLKRSRHLPTVSLFASYGAYGFGYDRKPNDFLKFYPVGLAGLQFSFPLFDGTVTQKKIAEKKLQITNNELQLQWVNEQNAMQIANVYQQKKVTQSNLETTSKQLKLAQDIYEQTLLQQKQGIATITDVLLADNDVRKIQQDYITYVVEYMKANLELKRLTGNMGKAKN